MHLAVFKMVKYLVVVIATDKLLILVIEFLAFLLVHFTQLFEENDVMYCSIKKRHCKANVLFRNTPKNQQQSPKLRPLLVLVGCEVRCYAAC